jgi:hypothetical protein
VQQTAHPLRKPANETSTTKTKFQIPTSPPRLLLNKSTYHPDHLDQETSCPPKHPRIFPDHTTTTLRPTRCYPQDHPWYRPPGTQTAVEPSPLGGARSRRSRLPGGGGYRAGNAQGRQRGYHRLGGCDQVLKLFTQAISHLWWGGTAERVRKGTGQDRTARRTIHVVELPNSSRALEIPWPPAGIGAIVRNLGLDFRMEVECIYCMVRDLDQEVHAADTVSCLAELGRREEMSRWILPSDVFLDLQVADPSFGIEVAVPEGLETISPIGGA